MSSSREIRFPNVVQASNTTLACRFCDGVVDLSGLADGCASREILQQLTVARFFLTFSAVTSNFNGVDDVYYHEVLLKLPVQTRRGLRVFPVRTWVDNELSLVRGYLLGFNKYFVPIPPPTEERVTFEGCGISVDVAFSRTAPFVDGTVDVKSDAATFLVFRAQQPLNLVISDYELERDSGWLQASGGGMLAEHTFEVIGTRHTADHFMLHGSVPL